jgi:hypothetical protein
VLLFDGGTSNGSGIEDTIRLLANDFVLKAPGTVSSVDVWAFVDGTWDGTIDYSFYESSGNLPSETPFASGSGINITQTPTGETAGPASEYLFHFELQQPLMLQGGQRYWFGLHLKQSYADDGSYAYWSTTDLGFGETSRSAQGGDTSNWGSAPDDEAFRLYGVPEPASALQGLAAGAALLGCRRLRRARAPALSGGRRPRR